MKKIDEEAFYERYLERRLAKKVHFDGDGLSEGELMLKRLAVVYETAKTCMTTAFCIWCHLAATTYITHTDNAALKREVLPKLLKGEAFGGNRFTQFVEIVRQVGNVAFTSGKNGRRLPCQPARFRPSNIGENHAFAFIAEVDGKKKGDGFLLRRAAKRVVIETAHRLCWSKRQRDILCAMFY